jgi:hypothetical protein
MFHYAFGIATILNVVGAKEMLGKRVVVIVGIENVVV